MRSLILATSVAVALGSVSAVAQTGLSRVTTSNNATPATSTASTTTTTTTTTSSAEGLTTGPVPSGASPAGTSTTADGGASSAFGNNTTSIANTNSAPSFGPGGSFANDSGNTALGTSPGQTSSGTAAGNSSSGLGAGSATLDPANVGTIGAGPAVTNPDGTVLGGATGVNVVGERVLVPGNGAAQQPAPSFSIINTPTFDQVAREGRAKEQARKARGEEPRVYGIAPRTENDLTWQMPDDKIIRY